MDSSNRMEEGKINLNELQDADQPKITDPILWKSGGNEYVLGEDAENEFMSEKEK